MTPEKIVFSDDVAAAIIEKQSITRKIVHILLQGLPGSGKTSLLDRLLNKPLRVYYSSTGMCEKTVIVTIGSSSTHTSVLTSEDNNTWKVTDFDESMISQLDSSKEFFPKATEEGSELYPGMTHKRPRLDIHEPVSENVREVLGKHNIKNLADLKNKNSIYIRDTGGQVEFQESLSLLIFGPSLFIFVMKTDVDIHTKNKIQYRLSSGEIINQYESSISTMDALTQFLTSVSAIQTTEEGVFKVDGTSVCHEPVVFIVGTHIDKLGSEAQSVLADINKTVDEMIRNKKFSPFIRYADIHVKKVLYEVDNTCENDKGFQHLRCDINQHIRDKSEFLVKYPVSYLLFCLELQNINEAVIPIDKFKKLAAKFNIEDKEIGSLLHFLHFRVGIIQHYNVQGISDLIIKEPQVIFNKVTELILKTFLTSTSISSTQQERFCKKGILEASAFDRLLNKEDHITPYQFLLFLTHLHVAVPITDKSGVKQYFIPSVLNHSQKSPSGAVNTDIAPLSITFQLGHCPKGLFAMLISYLLNPEGNQELTFDLLEDQIYQDQVSLLISSSEDLDQICLKSHISHLEVSIGFENSAILDISEMCLPRVNTPNEVCNRVRQVLHHCIQKSMKKLHYNYEKVGIGYSLRCHLKECGQLHEVKMSQSTCFMHCSTRNCKLRLPNSGQIWFKEGSFLSSTPSEFEVDSATISSKSPAHINATVESSPIQHTNFSRGSSSVPHSSSNVPGHSLIPDFSLRNLTLLNWTDKDGQPQNLRLRDDLSVRWRDLGDLLGQSDSRIDGIFIHRLADVRQCCRDVLLDWLKNGSPHYPASWEGLLRLLKDLQLNSLLEILKSALNKS